jgi:hypothetical protein
MIVLAIDPGPTVSAAVLFDCTEQRLIDFKRDENPTLREWIRRIGPAAGYVKTTMAVEMIASYGMPVGAEVFETCVEIGRYIQQWITVADRPHVRVYRREVKLHLCGSARATDGTVRKALLDRFGPGREKAVGTKHAPGPLYGLSADLWAALGVAIVVSDGEAKRAA